MGKFDMHDKVVLVTGASSGIGRASAELLANMGASVFITARREERLQQIKADIEAKGGICAYQVCDVSKEGDCKAAVEACINQFGKLDVLVNSAGISGSTPNLSEQFETDNFNNVMRINFDGVFYMIKYAYEECAKTGGGSIINISSVAALRGSGPVVYTAAKGAIKSLTRKLGKEFGPMNIRINSVYPGLIETEMTAEAIANKEYYDSRIKDIPLGRVGQAEDIAYCVLYLASDASAFVTGQDFVVDGGSTC
jgi:NAD(P)-dependent dehydrogenase (short-subunit alcohol dehydrogenase family)